MSKMALSVKAYLLILPSQQEIRRFSIDDGASSNYEYLLTKIRTVFPGIRNKHIRLFWKDEDGELVTFSSDEELVEALGSIQGEVFRVYIKIIEGTDNSEKQDDESTASQPEHVGVVCDGCDHGIFGVRFKCVVCPDYDLCMKCERKGLHSEHEMLRICTPRMHSAFSVFYPPFTHHIPPPPHHPPGCGPRPHHPPGFGPWGRGRGFFRGGPFGRGRCGGPRGRCGKATDAKCNKHTETAPDSQDVPVGPPFLHAMGEAIANFLGPMGVEVHTYADNEKDCCQGKCSCDHSEPGLSTETAASTSAEGKTNEAAKEADTEQDSHSTASTTTEKSDQQTSTEDYVMVDQDKHSKDKEEVTSDEASSTPEDPLEVAIAQMKAMGFEDHDGWLSQLIVSKEYDIGKVLDAMQYSQQ